jgi:hypothetical protein
MGVFTAPSVLAYKANGATLNANLTFNPGDYNTGVQAWTIAAVSHQHPSKSR